jgi:hypothetical protein
MSIQVIGAGMGRTGTMSLKHALEALGYMKCHHMIEVIGDESGSQFNFWKTYYKTGKVDHEAMFKGYTSVVDFPGSIFYKDLMAQYPDAKIILTVRDPENWYKSVSDTIYPVPRGFKRIMMKAVGLFNSKVRHISKVLDWVDEMIWSDMFEGKFPDKQYALKRFTDWNEEVKKTVPADRLLVFDIKEGWEPLCAFLGVPVPDMPFPRLNDTASFKNRKLF